MYSHICVGMARRASILCVAPAEDWEGGGVKLWGGPVTHLLYIYRYGASLRHLILGACDIITR